MGWREKKREETEEKRGGVIVGGEPILGRPPKSLLRGWHSLGGCWQFRVILREIAGLEGCPEEPKAAPAAVPAGTPQAPRSPSKCPQNPQKTADLKVLPPGVINVYSAFADAGWSSLVARRAHNPKVVGSNPAPATKFLKAPYLYVQVQGLGLFRRTCLDRRSGFSPAVADNINVMSDAVLRPQGHSRNNTFWVAHRIGRAPVIDWGMRP